MGRYGRVLYNFVRWRNAVPVQVLIKYHNCSPESGISLLAWQSSSTGRFILHLKSEAVTIFLKYKMKGLEKSHFLKIFSYIEC